VVVPVMTAVVPMVAAMVAMPTSPAVVGQRSGAGRHRRLLSGAGRGEAGHGGRGRDEVLHGVCGAAREQGAGCGEGDQAGGGTKLFSHIVSFYRELARDPLSIETLLVLYSSSIPAYCRYDTMRR
jgi:hypothetical protein